MSEFSLKANLAMEEGVYWSLKDSLPGIEGYLKMYTTPSGVPIGPSQLHSISVFSEAP